MGIWGLIGMISGALVSIWAAFKFIIGQSFRLDDNLSKNVLPIVQKLKYKFELNNEISINKRYHSMNTFEWYLFNIYIGLII